MCVLGKQIGLKSYRLCRIAFQTVITLIFIGWRKFQRKVINWTVDNLGMSRQMGVIVSSCKRDAGKQEADDRQSLMDQLQEQITRNGELQKEVDTLRNKIDAQNEMIEKQFGKDIERTAKGKCNNAGDMIQPTSLSVKYQEMFDQEWRSVMKTMFRNEKELTGITFLSKILEDCQLFCQVKAKEQLVKFVYPYTDINGYSHVEEIITTSEELHYLYKLRRTIGMHESNKDAVINLFSTECMEREEFRIVNEEIKANDEAIQCLEAYIKSCCDLCWQSAISDPPVLLKFDVLGEQIGEVSGLFQQYHYNSKAEEEGVSNTVMRVVWPAVVMKDGDTDILIENAKGYVIVYTSSAV